VIETWQHDLFLKIAGWLPKVLHGEERILARRVFKFSIARNKLITTLKTLLPLVTLIQQIMVQKMMGENMIQSQSPLVHLRRLLNNLRPLLNVNRPSPRCQGALLLKHPMTRMRVKMKLTSLPILLLNRKKCPRSPILAVPLHLMNPLSQLQPIHLSLLLFLPM
jgi:hypothetical protein